MILDGLLIIAFLTQAPQAPQAVGSIQGFVVKMGSADPVSKARVTLTRAQGGREAYTATTESGGRFAFQNLEPGQYRLSVQRNGYIRTEYGQRSLNRPGLPITLGAGQNFTDVVLQLVPAGTIAGRIFDRDGEPLPNVQVQALRYTYREGNRVLTSVQQARTNDLGEYRLFWLTPGQYYVSATYNQGQQLAVVGNSPVAGPGIGGAVGGGPVGGQRGGDGGRGGNRGAARGGEVGSRAMQVLGALSGMMDQPAEDEGYIPTYYPNTTDPQTAAPINLGPGVTYGGVDLAISPVRTLRVRGHVVDATTGQPPRGAQVMLVPRREGTGLGMNLNLRARLNDQGVFEIRGAVPGSYEVVSGLQNRNARLTARVPIEVGGADVDNVALILSPGYSMMGRLAIEGRPLNPNDPELARMRVNLRPDASMSSAGPMGGPPPASTIGSDGSFTLQQVGQGDYRLSVSAMPQNHYVKMARMGSVDVLDRGLRISEQPSAPLEILISPNTATVEGTVTDDKQQPAINVTVVLVPEQARRHRLDLYRMTSTDAAGRFRFPGLTPGDYKLFAWEDVEQGAWQDPEFIRIYEERGKSYRLPEGGQQTADLRVIPPQM